MTICQGEEACKACGWSKEEKENLEVALHRTQEQVGRFLVLRRCYPQSLKSVLVLLERLICIVNVG